MIWRLLNYAKPCQTAKTPSRQDANLEKCQTDIAPQRDDHKRQKNIFMASWRLGVLATKLHYNRNPISYFLLPFSLIYLFIITTRKWLYQIKIFKSYTLPVPVIVVGNITLGGTGKTPLIIYLVELLKENGFKPGVISRGYGGHSLQYPVSVTECSFATEVGDEPLLIAKRTQTPLVVDPNRPRAAKHLLANFECDIILSDDGLQHYALQRDIEICVVDGERQFGNGLLFPAGPLRESKKRLDDVDFVVVNGVSGALLNRQGAKTARRKDNRIFNLLLGIFNNARIATMEFVPQIFVNAKDSNKTLALTVFNKQCVHAVAGIGNPQRFFQTLKKLGINIIEHAFADHHSFQPHDLEFNDNAPVIMTEKDAVKCREFVGENVWYLKIAVSVK